MMSEKEFTDMAAELRVAAVRSAAAAGIGVEGAEDVAQDIMLRLWTLRDNISSARHARGLAVVAARNRALDMLRQSHTVSSHGIADDGSDCCPVLGGCRYRYRGRGDRCMAAAQTPGSAAHAASGVAAATDRTEEQCRDSCHTGHQASLGGHAALKGTQTAARRYQKT